MMSWISTFTKTCIGPAVGIAICLPLSVNGAACAAGGTDPRLSETKFRLVRDRAVYDFDCPKEQLVLAEIDDVTLSVSGCGKDASYTLQDCFLRSSGTRDEHGQSECIPVVKKITNRR